MSDYITLTLKISKEDMKEFLTNFYDEEYIEEMDIEDLATDAINGILQNEFSDFCVIDKNTIVLNNLD